MEQPKPAAPTNRTSPSNPVARASTVQGAFVLLPDGGASFGSVLRIAAETSVLQFRDEPVLPIGSWTDLRFSIARAERTGSIRTRVMMRIERSDGRTYGFWHRLDSDLMEALGLQSAAERRRVRRRRVREPVAIQIGDVASGSCHGGTLHDISPAGAGVVLALEDDRSFPSTGPVQLTFRLGAQPPFAFVATIRRRRLDVAAMHYGLQFDLDATPHGAELTQRLTEAIGD
ncbi:MAG: PilZ domain-containing protein [Planctomycetota bacterium]